MPDLVIQGGKPLSGTIQPSGSKGAVLPILCATLLTDGPVTLRNVPEITDVQELLEFFEKIGSSVRWRRGEKEVRVCHKNAGTPGALKIPRGMRASVLLLAPLLQRFGTVAVDAKVQGACVLESDLEILQESGVTVRRKDPLELALRCRFRSTQHWQDCISVSATEIFVMAAALAEGEAELVNAASEPDVQDFCRFLISMGAQIEGVGTNIIRISGVSSLHGAEASISSDQHEIAAFLALGAITGGEVRVRTVIRENFTPISRSFQKLGVHVEFDEHDAALVRAGQVLAVRRPFTPNLLPKIEAAAWPYFPVGSIPLMVALAGKAKGEVLFWNKVHDGGFYWTSEMVKFGAHVVVADPHRIIVLGNKPLRPATVGSPATINAALGLIMLAAAIDGQSTLKDADRLWRARPHFFQNLRNLGADIGWMNGGG